MKPSSGGGFVYMGEMALKSQELAVPCGVPATSGAAELQGPVATQRKLPENRNERQPVSILWRLRNLLLFSRLSQVKDFLELTAVPHSDGTNHA